jgi:hypothetical protein
VPGFDGLPEDVLAELAAALGEVHAPAGTERGLRLAFRGPAVTD